MASRHGDPEQLFLSLNSHLWPLIFAAGQSWGGLALFTAGACSWPCQFCPRWRRPQLAVCTATFPDERLSFLSP